MRTRVASPNSRNRSESRWASSEGSRRSRAAPTRSGSTARTAQASRPTTFSRTKFPFISEQLFFYDCIPPPRRAVNAVRTPRRLVR